RRGRRVRPDPRACPANPGPRWRWSPWPGPLQILISPLAGSFVGQPFFSPERACGQKWTREDGCMTYQQTLIPQRIEGIASPKLADERTLRMCFSAADAVAASILLSGLTFREIAARMGASKSLVNALAKSERNLTHKRTKAFCN